MKPSKTHSAPEALPRDGHAHPRRASRARRGRRRTRPDAPVQIPAAPAPIAGTDWTGFYAGGQIEYGDVGVSGAATDDGTGALGGIFAGYRYDFGSYVIGAELDHQRRRYRPARRWRHARQRHPPRLEAGFDAGPALIYGTGGAARERAIPAGRTLSERLFLRCRLRLCRDRPDRPGCGASAARVRGFRQRHRPRRRCPDLR
jgi:hypothetical protein